jgi:RHS repeat-associated protein
VLDELQGGAVTRTYSYGLELINERQSIVGTPTTSFYGYDGHGSVRFLTSSTGAVTDTYNYDAFGTLISSTGSTPNSYLFAGEQFDPVLGIYYNRARYYDQRQGRFWTMDTWEGDLQSPISLHKYLYVSSDPVNRRDLSGHDELAEVDVEIGAEETIEAADMAAYQALTNHILASGLGVGAGTVLQSGIALTVSGSILLASVSPFFGSSSEDALLRNGHNTDGSTVLFAFGSRSAPRAPRVGIDIHPDGDGMVGPAVPPSPQEGASAFANPQYAPLTGFFHGVSLNDVVATDGLAAVPDGSDILPGSTNSPTHWTIYPSRRMNAQQFIDSFLGLPWQLAGKK